MVVLMRKDSPLAQNDVIKPKDLWNVPLLCSRQSMVGKEISQWIGRDFDKLNIVATYNLVYNASIMVDEGIGYALSLDKLVNTTGNSALCFKLLEPKLEVGLNIIWKNHKYFLKLQRNF